MLFLFPKKKCFHKKSTLQGALNFCDSRGRKGMRLTFTFVLTFFNSLILTIRYIQWSRMLLERRWRKPLQESIQIPIFYRVMGNTTQSKEIIKNLNFCQNFK